MVRQRNCRDCKKELTGKYYLISGVGGYEASRANFCSLCCDKKKNAPLTGKLIKRGEVKVVEKEVGDKLMDEISEFEDKWEKYSSLGITKKILPDNKTFLNSIQKARQELEPYLQKPEIVEKAWEKEYDTDIDMSFYYLFAKSTRDNDYRQKVVQPTIKEVLGEKLDEEINNITTGNSPGVSGRADGDFKINGKLIGKYNWIDHEDDCRRLSLSFWDNNKFALRSFCRALAIKEKELKKETSGPNQQGNDNDEQNNPPPPKPNPLKNQNKTENPDKPNYALWISVSVGSILFIGLVIWFLQKKKKNKKTIIFWNCL